MSLSNWPLPKSAVPSSGAGRGIDESGSRQEIRQDGRAHRSDLFRPTEVDLLIGDSSKARAKLGWKPKTSFNQLVKEMVAGDLAVARQEAANGKNSV